MKTNVHYVDTHYFINYEKKTVVCKLTCQIPLAVIKHPEAVMKLPRTNAFITSHKIVEDQKVGAVLFTVISKAKCATEDAFDKELGKKIALTRAQAKAFTKASNFYGTLLKLINEELCDNLFDLESNCYNSATTCYEHAYELS